MTEQKTPNLKVRLGNLVLQNPVVTCSGTFGSGIEYSNFYDTSVLGAVTTKSFSLNPKPGNHPPRIFETTGGILNSIGLQNPGINSFLENDLPAISNLNINAILSIFGESREEFEMIAELIAGIQDKLLALELNLSCPNVDKGGMAFCSYPGDIKDITLRVKKFLDIPLIVKLSPNVGDLREQALAARQGEADAVSLINTIVGTAFDIDTFRPRLGNITGGLSGPAIKPIALAKVLELCRQEIIPVIGMGGIFDYRDALEFLIAGASAIGIGTVNFIDYNAGKNIINGITDYLVNKNIDDINYIIGKAFR
ncbi:MAG: dihydroorotate dehydrogenase [Actinomycetota bacterium]|nr:dihydroorotate dehydrogenase [Actinomycetota bacterium]